MRKKCERALKIFFADLNDILFFRYRRRCRYCGGGHCMGLCAPPRRTADDDKKPSPPETGRDNGAGDGSG
ncbi:MAG: hypothetical protein LBR94_06565 [Desulfovibrio sp.]|nr:hypothetical protein [Desulfovibrio sp.]